MPYGGVRRRPGPLLGGSAILTQRNNQQRLQYLQQLQHIVHPKEQQQNYGQLEILNGHSSQHVVDITNQDIHSSNTKISNPTMPEESSHQSKASDSSISNTYPDLLSHELPHTPSI